MNPAVLPKALTQLCIVHLVRASLRYVNAMDTPAVVAALKATTTDEAAAELDHLEEAGGKQYQAVVRLWRNNWMRA